MFTNQKVLGIFLIIFIVGAGIYFAATKFKEEVTNVVATPTPTPSVLDFLFNKSQTPSPASSASPSPQPSEPPYFRNKNVGKYPGVLTQESLKNKKAVISTNKGIFEMEIFTDTPIGSSNFILLAANGFYDGLKFHRVEKDFVVQGGDPLGDGIGGPGYTFQDEAVVRDYNKGMVAYANAGPNTSGSQFFIMLADHLELPKKYTIFGAVIMGQEVVDKLSVGDVMEKVIIKDLK